MITTLSDILTIISLFVGITSIILALYAMKAARQSEKESRENFEKTQKMMLDISEKTNNSLHEIDKKSAIIEEVTQKHQMQLTQLFSNVLDKVVYNPVQIDIDNYEETSKNENTDSLIQGDNNHQLGQQLAMQLLPELIKNPDSLGKLVEVSEKLKNTNSVKS